MPGARDEAVRSGKQTTGHDLCALSELKQNDLRCFVVNRRLKVAVVRVNDGVRAFKAICPHRGAPLSFARVRLMLRPTQPGEIELDSTHLVVACPWHNWEFSLDTGRALFDEKRQLITYDTHVQDGRVVVDI
jgi:nitrite reductase/ring-hydroxylating ferredoxin subunit